ncbi:MAG: hypothetical protein ACI8X5_002580 [Planctomycetota bacterium]|jgi:hypothetical protein
MQIRTVAQLCLLFCFLAPQVTGQDTQPEKQDPPGSRFGNRFKSKSIVKELRRADGSVVLPGELPANATDAARAAWSAIVASMGSEEPMESFLLHFRLRLRNPGNQQSNDLNLAFSFLSPSFVRAKFESNRSLLRGPLGDYLIDNDEVIKLFTREGAEDKKQLDQMASIASNFVSLTTPVAMRLTSLKLLETLPEEIFGMHRSAAGKLSWIEVTSPDFFLQGSTVLSGQSEPILYRARLGVDPKSKAIRMALIHRIDGTKLSPSGAMFLNLAKHVERSDLLVPHQIEVFDLDPQLRSTSSRPKPSSMLYLDAKRGRFQAHLDENDFLPPTK